MKYLLLLVALPLLPATSGAQTDDVGVYVEVASGFCSIQDVPGPRTLYVAHRNNYGAVGSQFHIEYSSAFTGTLLGSSSPFANVTGDPLSEITVLYDSTCQVGRFHILTLEFMLYGGSPDCSWIRIAPDPLVCDCNFEWTLANWEGTHVSSELECRNQSIGSEIDFCRPYYEPTLRTDAMTWGAVKALYR